MLTFLIGAAEYPVEETDARWLERVIRAACVDPAGRPWDLEARAALQVADVIREDLGNGHCPEPIDLWRTAAVGLLHTFNECLDDVQGHVAHSTGIAALYLGLRRFARYAA